jgi:uncharacterized OsmC-like protein
MEDERAIGIAFRTAREYLRAHPDEAAYTDSPATATIEDGLRVRVDGPNGASVVTDMPPSIGGRNSAPSAGWLLRASIAACDATLVALRAAEEGVSLDALEVHVESDSDDRGITGADDSVPPGPLRARIRIAIRADGVSEERLREIVRWAHAHGPVDDAVQRAIPVDVDVAVIDPSG